MIRNRPWAPPFIALGLIALAVFAANVLEPRGREEVSNTPEGSGPSAPESKALPGDRAHMQPSGRYHGAAPAPDPASSAAAPSPGVPAKPVAIDPYYHVTGRYHASDRLKAALHRTSTP
jgi:hypothetical protein